VAFGHIWGSLGPFGPPECVMKIRRRRRGRRKVGL